LSADAVARPRGCVVQKEIAHGEFVKRITLPVAVEHDRIGATYEDGFLIVVAPIAATAYQPTARTELHILVKRTHS
jgi:HSP20 family molecular chaperone IbpA